MNCFNREMLAGKWYRSERDKYGNESTEYAHLTVDGCFEFSFITHHDNGNISNEVVELGDWGLVGDIHFTITKNEIIEQQHYAADLTHEDNYQAYQVLQLTHLVFEYQHIITKERYLLQRVLNDKTAH